MSRSRQDVIEVAGRLFAERGYHATSMRALGRELGLLGSSLYAHIQSKEELLVAVVEDGARFFEAAAAAVVGDTPEAELKSLVAGHLRVIAEHPNQARTFLAEARSLDQAHRDRIIAARDHYEEAFRTVLRKGIADGSFRVDLDPKTGSIFILSMLNAVERWYHPDGPMDQDALAATLSDFALRAMRR